MAKTKLTLSVERDVVERAKDFAERHSTSVSSLVESYLERIAAGSAEGAADLPPIVSRLRGLGRPSAGREEHRRHLEEKYRR